MKHYLRCIFNIVVNDWLNGWGYIARQRQYISYHMGNCYKFENTVDTELFLHRLQSNFINLTTTKLPIPIPTTTERLYGWGSSKCFLSMVICRMFQTKIWFWKTANILVSMFSAAKQSIGLIIYDRILQGQNCGSAFSTCYGPTRYGLKYYIQNYL